MADASQDHENPDDRHEGDPAPEPTLAELKEALETEKRQRAAADAARVKAQKDATETARRLKEREEADRKKQHEGLPDEEKLKTTLKETLEAAQQDRREKERLEGEIRRLQIDAAIEREAQNLFRSPSAAPRVIDRAQIDIDPDSGKVIGVKKALEAVLKEFPELGKASSGGGTPHRETPPPRAVALPPTAPVPTGSQPRTGIRAEEYDPTAELLKRGSYY